MTVKTILIQFLPFLLLSLCFLWSNKFVVQQPEYEKDLNRKEQEKLKGKVSLLSEEDKTVIYKKGQSI